MDGMVVLCVNVFGISHENAYENCALEMMINFHMDDRIKLVQYE